MLDLDSQRFSKRIDAVEPRKHTLVKHHVLTALFEIFLGERNALFLAFSDHHEHISEDLFYLVRFGDVRRFTPEILGIHAEILDEIVFLHIRGAEGLVKII